MSKAYWTSCFTIIISICTIYANQESDHGASFIREASNTTLRRKFDYIIVGGGTAGCALAATLSQRFKVLVLERGGSPYGNPNITRAENSDFNFAYPGGIEAPNQAFTSEEGVENIRANVLGGGSSINGGVYARSDPGFLHDARLDLELVNSSYKWVEKVVAFAPAKSSALQQAVRGAAIEAGLTPSYGFTYDYVIGTKTNGIIFDEQGRRHPSSDLLFAYANRGNIQVLLHATAQRILFGGNRALGVVYSDNLGQLQVALLDNSSFKCEIILSAGALGSPQLLLLSGIGPKEHLNSMGIKPVLYSPFVGKNIADNPATGIYLLTRIPLSRNLIQQIIGTSLENFIVSYYVDINSRGAIFQEINGPISTGELLLRSLNVSDTPRVRFNYYQSPEDLERCVAGVNGLEEMLLSHALGAIIYNNQTLPSGGTVAMPDRRNSTLVENGYINKTITEYCLRNFGTDYHYHGGCRMGEVVDYENFRVMGVKGLRVVDGSTFKRMPGSNPQATVMMLGRYVGIKIIQSK